MDFEDSHQETVYYVVSAFEGKTYEDVNKDYRVRERRDVMRIIIYDAFRYGDGLLDDRIFRNNQLTNWQKNCILFSNNL